MADTFVGRERELAQLAGLLDRALAGTSQVVFVAGEAGSGKSSLVEEFVRRAQEAHPDLIAAVGECNAQTGAGDPYLPFRQMLAVLTGADDQKRTAGAVSETNAARLKEFVRISGETLLDVGPDLIGIFVPGASLLAKIATTAASKGKLADRLAERVQKDEAAAIGSSLDQERIFEQYAHVLAALSRQQPLILILDDLHWADSASLNLLFHLARQMEASRVLMVGTYRPDDVALGRVSTISGRVERHPLDPILNELRRYAGDVVIDLDAAQADEGRALADALVDAEPNRLGAAFRQELYARTEGHPLFTVELLRTLQERGDLVRDAGGRWVQAGSLDWEALPARVEGVIAERLGRLTDEAREALTIGSVMGREFAAQVVASVQQLPERGLVSLLARELDKRHRLVQETGEVRIGRQFLSWYRFAHALFQQFLYDEMSAGERRLLHGDVAAVLETLYADRAGEIAAQLAQHYQEAGEDEKAIAYLMRAGDAAFQAYAQNEAAAYYSRALNLGRSGAATSDQLKHLYLQRGRAFELSEHYDRALANYEEMQALGQKRGDRSLELEALMARALAHAVGAGVWDLSRAQALAEDALALANDLADRAAEARIYWILLLINRFGNEGARKAVEYGERSLALARELGLKVQLAFTLKDLSVAFVVVGRFLDARALLPEALSLWRELDNKPMLAEVLGGVCAQSLTLGELHEAIRAGEESYALNQSIHNRFGLVITATFVSIAYEMSGQMDAAMQRAQEAISIGAELHFRSGPDWAVRGELATMSSFLGDYDRAIEFGQQAIAAAAPEIPGRLGYLEAGLAGIYLQRGQQAEAEALLDGSEVESFESVLFATGAVSAQTVFARAELALVQGDPERARVLVEEVIGLADRQGIAIVAPPALHIEAKALWLLGRRDEARSVLLDARARAEAMQARYLLLPILVTLHEWEIALGHPAEADAVRREANEVVAYIAEHAPVELRASFLNRLEVRAVTGA